MNEERWMYISFADAVAFKGLIITRKRSVNEALRWSHAVDRNPGGQALIVPLSSVGAIPPDKIDVLITDKDEATALINLAVYDPSDDKIPLVAPSEMEAIVHEKLNNSLENGFDPRKQSIEENVIDLMTYDPDCEDMDEDEVRVHVSSWMTLH